MLIAQISDLHICRDGDLYEGLVPSNRMAEAAVEAVNALASPPDCVIVTGDLTDHGLAEEYAIARAVLDRLAFPYFVIPGNHDVREPMRAAFADHIYLPAAGPLHYCVDGWPVRIVSLDSTVPGKHHGDIDVAGLDWLDAALAEAPDHPTVILTHHHPFTSGICFLDEYRHFGASGLAGVIARHNQVERVLCGHVHRHMTSLLGGRQVMTCPSTASQIALRLSADAHPASFLEPPAGLLHVKREADVPMVTHLFPFGDHGAPLPFF